MKLKNTFVLILTIFFPFLIFIKEPGFNPLSFSEIIIFIILLFYYLISLKVKLGVNFIFLTFISWFLIFYFIILIPLNPKFTALLSHITHFKYMLVIFPIIKIFRKEDEIKMIKLLVLIGVLSQIPALYKFISQPASLLSLYGTGGYSRTESVFPNSNMYGAYLTVISLLNLFLIDYIKTFRYKLLLILVVQIPTFILLILTFSRRSWGLFILSLVIYTFFKKGQKKGLIVTISFVSIFMTLKLDLIVIFSRFQTIFSSDYASNSIRKDQFNELFNLISDNLYIFLLGMGPAITGPVSKLSINPQFTQIDNYFMLILLEYGVVGVLIYIILLNSRSILFKIIVKIN